MARPDIPIPDEPKAPFPILIPHTKVIAGFGRGSSSIGIPTANVPIEDIPDKIGDDLETGVYFGYVKIINDSEAQDKHIGLRSDGKTEVEFTYAKDLTEGEDKNVILPMVMSIGWNPFFKNEKKTCELHIIHNFNNTNFYGANLKFNILGYIRPELDYTTLEALIKDINIDIDVAKEYLSKPGYQTFKGQLD
ncbi:unnamed protein product [[Candida] boidinii]|nr:unnamed protein product [[Candida] boidinii]